MKNILFIELSSTLFPERSIVTSPLKDINNTEISNFLPTSKMDETAKNMLLYLNNINQFQLVVIDDFISKNKISKNEIISLFNSNSFNLPLHKKWFADQTKNPSPITAITDWLNNNNHDNYSAILDIKNKHILDMIDTKQEPIKFEQCVFSTSENGISKENFNEIAKIIKNWD